MEALQVLCQENYESEVKTLPRQFNQVPGDTVHDTFVKTRKRRKPNLVVRVEKICELPGRTR